MEREYEIKIRDKHGTLSVNAKTRVSGGVL
jgi:hypothetical protein